MHIFQIESTSLAEIQVSVIRVGRSDITDQCLQSKCGLHQKLMTEFDETINIFSIQRGNI